MPELPEVESTRRKLESEVLGDTITGTRVYWPRMWEKKGSTLPRKSLSGSRIESLHRRGKYLLICLDPQEHASLETEDIGKSLIIHLRMSGRIDVESREEKRSKYHHVVFDLASGRQIRFRDPRKFGRVTYTATPSEHLAHLGPEPLGQEFSPKLFAEMLLAKRSPLKTVLLDQRFLAGLGNIYVDESLWRARLHPLRTASTLETSEVKELHRAIRSILRKAIDEHGTDFGDNVIEKGNFKPKVYGRKGEPCNRCQERIQRIVVSQRGTSFCPNCQVPV